MYDFNPSPHTYKYYGVVELNELFARHGLETEFFGYMRVGEVSIRQRVLRPVKKLAVMLAVMLGIMPKTTGGEEVVEADCVWWVGGDAGRDRSADYAD